MVKAAIKEDESERRVADPDLATVNAIIKKELQTFEGLSSNDVEAAYLQQVWNTCQEV